MDYTKVPGKNITTIGELKGKLDKKTVSIVTPFYNGGKTLMETANSILSQTYPYYEWIIVDDGSPDKESLKKLAELEKMDPRITVYHKENGGPAYARDYGLERASKETKYVMFIDCDDIMDHTMLESFYWTLETHPDCSWTYADQYNFGEREFMWEQWLDVEKQKRENHMCTCSFCKKEDILEVGGYGIKGKALFEDWNLWLKLLAAGKKPIRVSAPLFWYRYTTTGEFFRAKDNYEAAMSFIRETASKVDETTPIAQFPREGDEYPVVEVDNSHMTLPTYKKGKKTKVLYIFPWMVTGGADLFNLELIKRLDKDKYEAVVLTTLPKQNDLRQQFEECCSEVYDLSTFLDCKDYLRFVDYIISSRNIDVVFLSNSHHAYYMVPYLKNKYPTIPFFDYIHTVDLNDPRGSFGRCSKDVENYLEKTYVCNNFTTNQLIRLFDRDPGSLETMYIGTDINIYDPKKYNREEILEKYDLPDDKIIVTFIARLSEEKRPLMFVSMAKRLLENNPNLHFLIAGDGPLYGVVQNKIDENFTMVGMVKDSQEIYKVTDLSINCSRLEGLALTSYESLAMGSPIISTDVGGQTELIDETVGAIIHYNENASKEIYERELDEYVVKTEKVIENLEDYKKNCRKKILKSFSFDDMVKKFDNIFTTGIKDAKKVTTELKESDKIFYQLGVEILYMNYYYYCKNYIETKYYIEYDKDKVIRPLTRLGRMKRKYYDFFLRCQCKDEVLVMVNFLRSILQFIKQTIRSLYYILKFFIQSIPAFFIVIYKVITRNKRRS